MYGKEYLEAMKPQPRPLEEYGKQRDYADPACQPNKPTNTLDRGKGLIRPKSSAPAKDDIYGLARAIRKSVPDGRFT